MYVSFSLSQYLFTKAPVVKAAEETPSFLPLYFSLVVSFLNFDGYPHESAIICFEVF